MKKKTSDAAPGAASAGPALNQHVVDLVAAALSMAPDSIRMETVVVGPAGSKMGLDGGRLWTLMTDLEARLQCGKLTSIISKTPLTVQDIHDAIAACATG